MKNDVKMEALGGYLSCPGRLLDPQVTAEHPKVTSKGQVRGVRTVKFGRSVRSCCRSYGNCRAAAQTQVKPEVKVYLSDKSYD